MLILNIKATEPMTVTHCNLISNDEHERAFIGEGYYKQSIIKSKAFVLTTIQYSQYNSHTGVMKSNLIVGSVNYLFSQINTSIRIKKVLIVIM